MKIAIVHEYLNFFGGAEKVLLDILSVFPKSDLFLLTFSPKNLSPNILTKIKNHKIVVSYLKRIQKFTPLVRIFAPSAIENLQLKNYDLVISNCNSYAKGILLPQSTVHISYIHSPTRYLWDYTYNYLKEHSTNALSKFYLRKLFFRQRKWDFLAAQRPDKLLANSKNIQKRIKKYYRRDSEILYPGISVSDFKLKAEKDNYFLIVSRLSPYKKVDLVIKTFKNLPRLKLKIVGEGLNKKRLQILADKADNIDFLGFVNEEDLKILYSKALAVLFPQAEDFGLVPIEAAASGTPTIAFKEGGALETIIDGETGMFFERQTEKALLQTINRFLSQKNQFNPYRIRRQAKKFDISIFSQKLQAIVKNAVKS